MLFYPFILKESQQLQVEGYSHSSHFFFVSAFISCKVTGSIAQKGPSSCSLKECFHTKASYFPLLKQTLPIQIHCTTQSLQKEKDHRRQERLFQGSEDLTMKYRHQNASWPFILTLKSLKIAPNRSNLFIIYLPCQHKSIVVV